MADDYANMHAAARNRDWQGCDRLMFRRLYQLSFEEQREVALIALSIYLGNWIAKHPNNTTITKWIIPPIDDSDQIDPADAEFGSALSQFRNALSANSHSKHTAHFASAIRSAVLARQIDRWLRDFPTQYESWRRGEHFVGPTFLEDDEASMEAERVWGQIDELFQKSSRRLKRRGHKSNLVDTADLERAYTAWENSLL